MSVKKESKKSAKKQGSKAAAMREMREKQANASDKKKAKEAKGKKKDNLVVMKGFEVLPPLKVEDRKEKAHEIDSEVRAFDKEVNARGLKMGIMLREMKGYELWKELNSSKTGKPFGSFDAWLKEAAPISRSGGYAQLKVAEKLLPLIPKDELAQYPDYARKLIAKVPKIHLEKVDSPIRKAARTARSERELSEEINRHAPEAHVETTANIRTNGAGVIDDMIQAAVAIGEVSKSDALEFVASDWLDSPCTRENYTHLTNREAWQALSEAPQGDVEEDSEDEPQGEIA